MKKISFILVVILIASLFTSLTANASAEALTLEEFTKLLDARQTVIDLRKTFEKSPYSGCYCKVYDSANQRYNSNQDGDFEITKDQLIELLYESIDGLSDFSLECVYAYMKTYTPGFSYIISLDNDMFKLQYPGGKGGFFSRDYDSVLDDYFGYTANVDGTFSFYYSEIIERDVLYYLAEEGITRDDLVIVAMQADNYYYFDYMGYSIIYDEMSGDFIIREPEYRVFNYRISDGKIEFFEDKWADLDGFTLPEFFSHDPNKKLGDVNGDDSVNNKDIVALFRYLSGDDVYVDFSELDISGDRALNNKDIVTLFKLLS